MKRILYYIVSVFYIISIVGLLFGVIGAIIGLCGGVIEPAEAIFVMVGGVILIAFVIKEGRKFLRKLSSK